MLSGVDGAGRRGEEEGFMSCRQGASWASLPSLGQIEPERPAGS